MDNVIEVRDIKKIYTMGEVEVHALRGVSFTIERGEVVSIMGPSGSGKSTLMNMLGCLDRPTSGEYYLDDELVSSLTDDQLARIRNKKVGFVFQSFNLLSRVSSLVNVALPLRYAGVTSGRRELAREALEAVGLGDRVMHRPTELSGGEQQRVAIARAMIGNPLILLADEPTGNLDPEITKDIMVQFRSINLKGTTVVIATHNRELLRDTDQRIIVLNSGRIVEEINI